MLDTIFTDLYIMSNIDCLYTFQYTVFTHAHIFKSKLNIAITFHCSTYIYIIVKMIDGKFPAPIMSYI